MQYKYRWIYAILLCFVLTTMDYIYDTNPLLTQLQLLKQAKHQLLAEINVAQASLKNVHRLPVTQSKNIIHVSALLDLTMLLQKNNLSIDDFSLKINPWQDSDQLKIHLVVSGYAKSLLNFLLQLNQEDFSMLIAHFKIMTILENQLSLSEDALITKKNSQSRSLLKNNMMSEISLMCPSKNSNELLMTAGSDQLLSSLDLAVSPGTVATHISYLKMTGYLQYDKQPPQALILLPNKTSAIIKQGSVVGLEHGIVTEVEPDQVHIQLPNKQWKLYLNKE